MARRSPIFAVVTRSIGAVFSNFGTVMFFVVGMGLIATVADLALYEWLKPSPSIRSAQSTQTAMIQVFLGWWAAMLVMEIVFGPLVGAAAVFIGRSYTHGTRAGIHKTLNFALNRYRRMIKWHAAAWLSIHVGMIVVVPGILFMLQYAFVDPVLCLEDERWPLARSKKLTRGRRRRIFLVALLVLIPTQVMGFAELAAMERGGGLLLVVMSSIYLLNFIVLTAFYMFYEDRTTPSVQADKSS